MSLTPRQVRFYVYTVDIWRQNAAIDADFQPYVRIAQDVKCYFESTPEADAPDDLGRTKLVNLLTMDNFHFELSQDIKDTDYLHMTAGPAGSLTGNWWAVHGNTRTHGFRANKQVVYAKQAERPQGAS